MITSVLGDIENERLGPTDCHDHLFIRGGLPIVLEPDFRLDSADAATAETRDVFAAGGRAIVDCMPLGVGRDAEGLVEVARASGLTIVAATGFHKQRYYAADHWIHTYDVDRLTALMVAESREGMDRSGYNGPYVDRIAARPGVIKVATTAPEPTATERKLLAAVGAAAHQTGLPVITHTENLGAAEAQLEALSAEGVEPERVICSHVDRHCDVDQLAAIARTGATVCLDWLARTDRRPDEFVADLVVGLLQKNLGEHVVIGQDLARRQYWRAYGGGPGLAHMYTTFVPLLQQAGATSADIDMILVKTPSRVFDHRNGADQ